MPAERFVNLKPGDVSNVTAEKGKLIFTPATPSKAQPAEAS